MFKKAAAFLKEKLDADAPLDGGPLPAAASAAGSATASAAGKRRQPAAGGAGGAGGAKFASVAGGDAKEIASEDLLHLSMKLSKRLKTAEGRVEEATRAHKTEKKRVAELSDLLGEILGTFERGQRSRGVCVCVNGTGCVDETTRRK